MSDWGPGNWPGDVESWLGWLRATPREQWPDAADVPPPALFRYGDALEALRDLREEGARAEAEGREPWDWLKVGSVLQDPEAGPRIEVADREVRQIAEDALAALVEGNDPPALFHRDGSLVCLMERSNGALAIKELSPADLRGRLTFAAHWMRTSNKGVPSPCDVPPEVVNALWSVAPWQFFPVLEGIVAAPVFSGDGRLCGTPGYLPGARLYYHERGKPSELPNASPGGQALLNAREYLLEEFLGDFPFDCEASKANALALLLTPFVRGLVDGPVPMFMLDAPTEGTGKGLLAECLISVFDPGQAVPTPATQDPEEWGKTITALLSDGGSHIYLDNVNFRLNSGELAAAITAGVWKKRRLGSLETVTLPCRCVWVVTGNNLQASGELADRVCWIRLDAQMERPSARSGFRHENLHRWVLSERRKLITACLTLVQCWADEGMPRRGIAWRTFTPWSEVLGGILAVAAVPGFLGNREALREKADSESIAMQQFVQTWWETYGTCPVGVAQLFSVAEGIELLSPRLGDGTERSQKTRLGNLLRRMEGRVYLGRRIEGAGELKRAGQYQLVAVEEV